MASIRLAPLLVHLFYRYSASPPRIGSTADDKAQFDFSTALDRHENAATSYEQPLTNLQKEHLILPQKK